jgi:hypothetical protein
LCKILFSPHRQHGAMQILVHVDAALHREFYFLHISLDWLKVFTANTPLLSTTNTANLPVFQS